MAAKEEAARTKRQRLDDAALGVLRPCVAIAAEWSGFTFFFFRQVTQTRRLRGTTPSVRVVNDSCIALVC